MSYNKTILMGRLTRDIDTQQVGQTTLANFGVATNRKFKDSSGNAREDVMFIDCKAWGKTAENMLRFFNKGDMILIEGRLTQEQWEDKTTGAKRSKHIITVDSFAFTGGNSGGGEGQQQQQSGGYSRTPSRPAKVEIDPDSIPF